MAQRKTSTGRNRDARSTATPVPAVVTTSNTVRMTEPVKSKKRRASKPKVVTIVGQTDDVLIGQAAGFRNFLRDYAIVGLALGFIVGQQANGVVKQLVASFLDPVFEVWFGHNLSSRTITWHHGHQSIPVQWGAFVYILLEFFFVVIGIYVLVKLLRLDKLKKSDQVEQKK